MRVILSLTLAAGLFGLTEARADEPKGRIGVQLKVEDGKIVVVEPIADGPAEKAGVKAGDVVLKVNDYKVKEKAEQEDLEALVKEVIKNEPDTKLKLVVLRDGKEKTIEVTVGKP